MGGIEVRKAIGKYPYLTKLYDTVGQLLTVVLWTSKNESFSYDVNGKFIVHWINNKGYDEDGKLFIERSFYKF